MTKRTWVYLQQPMDYGIDRHECGEIPQWSEFERNLWCPKCEIDYEPEHSGVFGGPIPIEAAGLMGIYFDRFILPDGPIERFAQKEKGGDFDWIPETS